MSKQELLQRVEEVARESLAHEGKQADEKLVKKVVAKMVKAMPSRALQAA